MSIVIINDNPGKQIHQGDIFVDISVLEDVTEDDNILTRKDILFPFVVCLNQECDLTQNFNHPDKYPLLHLLIVPAFLYSSFIEGAHWGSVFKPTEGKNSSTEKKHIQQNQIPRYHYLEFPENRNYPRLIIDFKQFFTINRDYLYEQMPTHRLCSLGDLFKESISQRFSYFLSRIGLP